MHQCVSSSLSYLASADSSPELSHTTHGAVVSSSSRLSSGPAVDGVASSRCFGAGSAALRGASCSSPTCFAAAWRTSCRSSRRGPRGAPPLGGSVGLIGGPLSPDRIPAQAVAQSWRSPSRSRRRWSRLLQSQYSPRTPRIMASSSSPWSERSRSRHPTQPSPSWQPRWQPWEDARPTTSVSWDAKD